MAQSHSSQDLSLHASRYIVGSFVISAFLWKNRKTLFSRRICVAVVAARRRTLEWLLTSSVAHSATSRACQGTRRIKVGRNTWNFAKARFQLWLLTNDSKWPWINPPLALVKTRLLYPLFFTPALSARGATRRSSPAKYRESSRLDRGASPLFRTGGRRRVLKLLYKTYTLQDHQKGQIHSDARYTHATITRFLSSKRDPS